ncbi:MAG: DUF58 domain-containing protein [Candidatus Hatepunaea meridiana]|nr:DUF58 domain-containing protein [Candidatus Hatepunaea meridiana]
MPTKRLLDPASVARLAGLQLRAMAVVEGFMTGLHQSPYRGFSVEFSQHRQYMPGDSLKHLDYKVLARTGRYYIKQFEEETNLKAHLLVDHSGSMGYGSGEITKLDYGSLLAAALSLLLLKQRDAVGLVTFAEELTELIQPRSTMGWLGQLTKSLEKLEPTGKTAVSKALLNIAERVKRRGLVVLISDLLDDPDKVIAGMKAIRHVGHELLVFHILDPLEISFAFPRDARFQDLETSQILPSRPWHIRAEYQNMMQEFIEEYKQRCRENRIDYRLFTTDTPYEIALFEFLVRRKRLI